MSSGIGEASQSTSSAQKKSASSPKNSRTTRQRLDESESGGSNERQRLRRSGRQRRKQQQRQKLWRRPAERNPRTYSLLSGFPALGLEAEQQRAEKQQHQHKRRHQSQPQPQTEQQQQHNQQPVEKQLSIEPRGEEVKGHKESPASSMEAGASVSQKLRKHRRRQRRHQRQRHGQPHRLSHFLPDRGDLRDVETRRWRLQRRRNEVDDMDDDGVGKTTDAKNDHNGNPDTDVGIEWKEQTMRLLRAIHRLYRDYRRACIAGCGPSSPSQRVGRSQQQPEWKTPRTTHEDSSREHADSLSSEHCGDLRVVTRRRQRSGSQPVHQVLLRRAGGAEVWIDAPLVLELRLPSVRAKLARLMAACPFVADDPVEALAELRAAGYDVQECVEYLQEVRPIRQTALQQACDDPQSRLFHKTTAAGHNGGTEVAEELKQRLSIGLANLRATVSKCASDVAALASQTVAATTSSQEANPSLLLLPEAQRPLVQRSHHRCLEYDCVSELEDDEVNPADDDNVDEEEEEEEEEGEEERLRRRLLFSELQDRLGSVRVFARCRRGLGEQAVVPCGRDTLRVIGGSRVETFQFDGVFSSASVNTGSQRCHGHGSGRKGCGGRGQRQQSRLLKTSKSSKEQPESSSNCGQTSVSAPAQSCQRQASDDPDKNGLFDELRPLIASFLDGYNVCFIAYGGEASGKTHTLHGASGAEQSGLVFRSLAAALAGTRERRGAWCLCLAIACLEIYNDALVDLGDRHHGPRRLPPGCLDRGLAGLFDSLSHAELTTEAEALAAIRLTAERRRVAPTALNPCSSRSHLLHLVRVTGKCTSSKRGASGGDSLCSFLGLVDLAGAENVVKAATLDDPLRAAEAGHINRSLASFNRLFLNLRRCSGARGVASYRDSRLTQLMKPFVTGRGKCCIIVTVRTDRQSLSATLSSLRFGRDARQVMLGRAQRHMV